MAGGNKSKKQVRRSTKTIAYENGLRRCPVCDRQLQWRESPTNKNDTFATVDHIVPASFGGLNTPSNYYVMCAKCNTRRGNIPFAHFIKTSGVAIDDDKLELMVFQACIDTVKGLMQQNQRTKPLSAMMKHVLKNFSPNSSMRLLLEQFYMVKQQ
jgi:hypothetical protein